MIRVTRETHETPANIRKQVALAGGINYLGEPNFRVVWGGSRLTWIGGRWTDRDAHGNVIREVTEMRREPKYLPVERWHVERWMPAEVYGSPEDWLARTMEIEDGIRIPALGPYPARGEYEHCFTLQDASGEFLPLSSAACDWIVRAVQWSRRQPRVLSRTAILSREDGQTRAWNRVADDVLDDAVPAFHGQPMVAAG